MIRGIHYFSTELKTKIGVIPRGCFNHHVTLLSQYETMTCTGVGLLLQIWDIVADDGPKLTQWTSISFMSDTILGQFSINQPESQRQLLQAWIKIKYKLILT